MTAEDFVVKYLGFFEQTGYDAESVRLLAAIVDTSKDGLISYPEFQAFEGLLCFPDALYKIAFQLFDTNGNGMVSFGKTQYCSKCYYLYVRCFNLGALYSLRLCLLNSY